ncbi:MAG: chorismate synthase [Oscillospiraceae bacterium]|nr:chorismate synthase [Oscillospiraceae bacterium]
MGSYYGENLRLTVFGQSHSPAVGCTLEGIPAGHAIDLVRLKAFMVRRASRGQVWATPRQEADEPEVLGGLFQGRTCGAPLAIVIRNGNTRSADYEQLKRVPRPGHADLTAALKYGGAQDYAGGGHFSGRLTAPLCAAGGVCLQLLEEEGIRIISRIASIEDVEDEGPLTASTAGKDFPAVSDECGKAMLERIALRRSQGDSSGGIVECSVLGLPAGLGDPMFGGMENRIAAIVFGIPAVKGVEFGAGFGAARSIGSVNNDPFTVEDGQVRTVTNNAGGILGGITDGMPLTFRAAFKPTPSIALPQQSVDLERMEPTELTVAGRHDPCLVPRAVPVVEAAAAIAVYDALLGRKKEL